MRNFKKYTLSLFIISILVITPSQAFAMHIMEGFLPIKWAILWFAIAIPFIMLGIKRINKLASKSIDTKMLIGLAGAFIFVLSSLKLPSVTGSTSHPTGVGLSSILFGPTVSSVLSMIVLIFQALLLAHGGISTLGANVFSMGIVGPFVAFFAFKLSMKLGMNRSISVFLAAALADLATYIITSIQLGLAFPAEVGGITVSIVKFMGIFAITQIPLAISEGLLTVVVFNLLITYNMADVNELIMIRGTIND